MLLAVLLALAGPPADTVELAGERHRELTARPVEASPGPWAERRSLTIAPAEGGLQIRGRWQIRSFGTGWFSGQLFGPTPGLRVIAATWNGQPAALRVDDSGGTIAGRVQGSAEVVVEAFVPGDPARGAVALKWLPAVRGRIEAAAPEGLVPAVKIDGAPALAVGGAFAGGAGAIDLAFEAPPRPAEGRPPVVVARVGIGLTVGEAELRGRARAVWEVRQGELSAVELQTAGLGGDLEVTGPNVRAWARAGESVRVELQAPVRDRVELELRWTTPIGRSAESRASVPTIAPAGVFRSETALQLARDGEVEAVPEAPGWSLVAAGSLPGWAQGLVEGTATASLVGGTGGELSLLRFVPLEGPPVVVDVASYTVATSREGRALVRAHYEVRNERAASLKLRPPAGFKVIGIRVGGKTATPARAKDGAWIVPLLRSVETVRGLLSFPVEVILLGESDAWRRREARRLELPRVDAPVAVSRVTLHLPPGYTSRVRPGEGDVVAAFTRGEGITYGLGVGEVRAAQADATFQDAVQAWMRNDFGEAQKKLDELRSIGAKNENIDRLQSNLDVVGGKASAGQDVSMQRRVREQAKARAYADVQAQAELKQKAEEARARGDYDAAASSYQQALQVGDKLAALEQAESVEQRSTNASLAKEIEAVTKASQEAKQRAAPVRSAKKSAPARQVPDGGAGGGDVPAGKAGGVSVYDFEDDTVDGVMLRPEGARLSGRVPEGSRDAAPEAPAIGGEGRFAEVAGIRLGGGTGSATIVQEFVEERVELRPPPPPEPAVPIAAGRTMALADQESPLASRRLERVDVTSARAVRRPGRAKRQALDTRARGEKERRAKDDSSATNTAGMPTPVVHASALSVVVPAVGEAVRYQRLLLPPDAAYSIEIAAKEPLFAKE